MASSDALSQLSHTSILELPATVLVTILDHLDTKDKLEQMKCCSTFARFMPFSGEIDVNAFAPHEDPVTYVDVIGEALSNAARHCSMASFHTVKLQVYCLDCDLARKLSAAFPGLAHLILYGPGGTVHRGALRFISGLRAVTAHRIICNLDDVGPPDNTVLGSLRYLKLDHVSFDDVVDMLDTTAVPGLRNLRISQCNGLDTENVTLLSKRLPNLKEITLCNFQGRLEIEWFRMCSKLEVLKFLNCHLILFSGLLMSPFSLRTLCLANGCTVSDFCFLHHLCSLEQLLIWCDNFTCGDLELLPSSLSLTYLDVSYTSTLGDELLAILLGRQYPLKCLVGNIDPRDFNYWCHGHREDCIVDDDEDGCSDSDFPEEYERCDCFIDKRRGVAHSGGFSSSALKRFLHRSPRLEVLSVNGHSSVEDTVFVKDFPGFRGLKYLRVVGTGITTGGLDQLRDLRKAHLQNGHDLPLLTVSARFDVDRYSGLDDGGSIAVNDNPMGLSKAELEMMSLLAIKSDSIWLTRDEDWDDSDEEEFMW